MLDGTTPLSRFRARVSPADLELVPLQSQETTQDGTVVHWATPAGEDPFVAGALWGLSWSLTQVFGEAVGSFLTTATLENVERWNGSRWVLVA